MKYIFIFLFSLAFVSSSSAQMPWHSLGTGGNALNANGAINALAIDSAGNLYAAGDFTDTTFLYFHSYVAKWNGTSWTKLASGSNGIFNGVIKTLAADGMGNIYAGGDFTNGASGSGKNYVAKWNGSSWSELGGTNALNANQLIWTITTDAANNVYAAGGFTNSAGKGYVAKFNGTSWSELGSGSGALNANNIIYTIAVDNVGGVYAGGAFNDTIVPPIYAGPIAVYKFDGTSWSRLGNRLKSADNANKGSITSIAVVSPNEVYVTGLSLLTNSNLNPMCKWDGTNWKAIDSAGFLSKVLYRNGSLYGGGTFFSSNGHRTSIFKWNGINWIPATDTIPGSSDYYGITLNDFAASADGVLYAAGAISFPPATGYQVAYSGNGFLSAQIASREIFSVYPNPTTGMLYIRSDLQVKRVQLYSITGALIKELTNTKEIDLDNLVPGIYFLRAMNEQGVQTFNFVKL